MSHPNLVNKKTTSYLLISILVIISCQIASAQNIENCAPPPQHINTDIARSSTDNTITIEADTVSGKEGEHLLFEGNVELNQKGKTIKADEVTITENPRKMRIEGNLEVVDQDMVIKAATAKIQNNGKDSEFTTVKYEFTSRHSYGKASSIRSNDSQAILSDASYTTCPGDNPAWELTAKKLTLNRESGFGTAKNAKFTFKGIPVLYTPFVSFPIDNRRKSGFLFPRVGQNNKSGLELSMPYYWNIAPQYDATLTPRFLSRRGLLLENEFRYMDNAYQGRIQVDYLPKDQVANNNRYMYSLDHVGKSLFGHWDIHLFGSATSDEDYLEDFGNNLGFISTSFLTRQAEARYQDKNNDFTALLRAYQVVDPNITNATRPYHLLPRLELKTRVPLENNLLKLNVLSEYSRFTHPQKTEGDRLNIVPRLSWNYITSGFYVKPALSWNITHYQTDLGDMTRSLPMLSLDSGLFFDKYLKNNDLLTFEPRFFYLYAATRNQDNIPLFDTSEPAFSVATLFRENRFSGKDRIGDANQLSFALAGRYVEHDKKYETLTASIGQIFYIDDPQVTLAGSNTISGNRSGFVSEITYRPDKNWFFRSSFAIDSDWKTTENVNTSLGYKDQDNRLFNLEHIYHKDDIEQTGFSVAWPINNRWRGLGRWLFSHQDSRTLEILAGLEYESCCWKLRLVNQRHVTDTLNDYNDSFYIQMVFKGVASVGEGSAILEKEISGYSTYE